jgi:hypothetical protein
MGRVVTGASSSGGNAATILRLEELAGPHLYRRNAFRVTGLPVMATSRAIRDRRQKADTYFEAGFDFPLDGDLPVPEPPPPAVVRSAFEVLGDARRRLVDEVLWLWGDPDGQCSCAPSVHAAHDAAVRAHALVLDSELADGEIAHGTQVNALEHQWAASAQFWADLLRRDDFWAHVKERVRGLDDRRLNASAVRTLRVGLPRTLVAPVVRLAEQAKVDLVPRVSLCRTWAGVGGYTLEDMLDEVAQPMFDDVFAKLRDVGERFEAGGYYQDARSALRRDVLPALNRLSAFWGPGSGRRPAAGQRFDAASDGAAVLLANSTIRFAESQLKAGASPLTIDRTGLLRDLERALRWATKRETQQGIEKLLREVRRIPTPETYLDPALRGDEYPRYERPRYEPRPRPVSRPAQQAYGFPTFLAVLVASIVTFLSFYSGDGVLIPGLMAVAATAVVVGIAKTVVRIKRGWPQ